LHVTGLIYVVIIGLWAAVLIPIWLKRQDQVSEVRSTARFSSAMRSLGDRADTKSGKSETHVRDFTSPRDRARAQAAKRRSLILAALTSITALALIGTVLGFIPAFVPIGAGVLLAAFLVTTMLTASKRDQAPVRKSARAYREFHEVESPREVVDYERPLTRAELQKAELDDFANWDPWDEEETPGWDAVPQTLPSYVNAPRATAVPRNIERNGDWSGESMVDMVAQSRAAQHNDLVREPVNNVSDATTEIPIIRANSSYQARAANG
jgi:hypothetical protein